MCKNIAFLSGYKYDEKSFKVCTRASLELNDEERKKGLLPYSGKDGSDGIQTVIGTYCIQVK